MAVGSCFARALTAAAGLALALACDGFGPGGAAAPRGTLRLNLGTEPPTLDWNRATDSVSITVIEQLMRGLTRLGPGLQPVPALAERWESSADGRTWRFHLRRDVRWSDGVPLEARHFVDGWRRLLDPETAAEYAYFLFDVEGARELNSGTSSDPETLGVRALGPHTLEVKLVASIVYFASITTFMVTFPVRLDLIDAHGDAWAEAGKLVTLGPFLLDEWLHEYRISLVRNPDFYAGPPPLERILGYMIEEGSPALVLFEQGLLDLVRLPPLEIRRYQDHPGYRHVPALRGYYYGFNTLKPPFDDVRVRRAFSMAIDRSQFPTLLRGGEIAAAYWLPPGMPNHNPEIGLRFDPEAARALLEAAGLDPTALDPIRVVYNTDQTHKLVAEKIQSEWQTHLGVRVELENREWKVFLRELAASPPAVYRLGWGADFPDPDNFMNLFTSWSANNHTNWENSKYDELVLEAARETDVSRRQELYDAAQRILCEDDAPIVPLFVSSVNLVVGERLRGFEPNAMDLLYLDQVWVE